MLWVSVLVLQLALGAAELTRQELRGRALYRLGLDASGEPIAASLAGETEVKGNVVPCAGCHGLDGLGRREGSVIPSSVRWQDLERPYEVTSPTGRKHAGYTERSLITAVALGLDPAGNKLHPVMPRYALTKSSADDLIAYLKVLAQDRDAGLTDDTIRIGTMLPSEKRFAGMAAIVRPALQAVFDDVNRAGGVYGRRIELVVGELPEADSETGATYSRFLKSQNVFALVSSFLAGAEEQALRAIVDANIPVVGGWTLVPRGGSPVFFLEGGLPAQVEALAEFGAKRYASDPSPVILISDDRLSSVALQAAKVTWTKEKFELASITRLKARKSGVVLALLPAEELRALIAEARRQDWNPVYLIPSALIPSSLMPDLTRLPSPVFAASSFVPDDVTPEGKATYQRLATATKLPAKGFASQFTAIGEARILIDGLKRAGRDLSRERLIESLEAIYDLPVGYKQTVSFGPGTRIGISKVHIVPINPR